MISAEQVNKSTSDEVKEYHLKKLAILSKPEPEELDFKVDGSVWRDGKVLLEQPSEEQLEWFERRVHGSARSWEAFTNGRV